MGLCVVGGTRVRFLRAHFLRRSWRRSRLRPSFSRRGARLFLLALALFFDSFLQNVDQISLSLSLSLSLIFLLLLLLLLSENKSPEISRRFAVRARHHLKANVSRSPVQQPSFLLAQKKARRTKERVWRDFLEAFISFFNELSFSIFFKKGVHISKTLNSTKDEKKGKWDGSFFVSTSKKKEVSKTSCWCCCCCCCCCCCLEEERRRRDGGREKRAEKSKPGRDGDAEAEKNASVAWSRGRRFFERGKEKFALLFFIFSSFFLPSLLPQRALCVVARDHYTHFASLGRASSSSSSVGPGEGGRR